MQKQEGMHQKKLARLQYVTREDDKIFPSKFVCQFLSAPLARTLLLFYEGAVNQEVTLMYTRLVEQALDGDHDMSLSIKRRVYHVMVELLQNAGKHASHIECNGYQECRPAFFWVVRSPSGFQVAVGNVIINKEAGRLSQMLDKVNKLNEADINAYYRRKIVGDSINTTGCAGLGFIDIVRKTGHPIAYDIERIDEAASYLVVKAFIS